MYQILQPFILVSNHSLEDHVYIKKFKEKQYLVISHLTFELNTEYHTFTSADNLGYYVNPDTLQCGYMMSAFDHGTLYSSYRFWTSDHDLKEQDVKTLENKLKNYGYLKIGRIIIGGKPYSEKLASEDVTTIQRSFNWLIEKTKSNKRKLGGNTYGLPNKKAKIAEKEEHVKVPTVLVKPELNKGYEIIYRRKLFSDLKPYLVVSNITFELGQSNHTSWSLKYYIHPTTLQVGCVQMCHGSMYDLGFRTKDHSFYDDDIMDEIYFKIKEAGYLEIGNIIVKDEPYTKELSKRDNEYVFKTLNWLVDVSNKN